MDEIVGLERFEALGRELASVVDPEMWRANPADRPTMLVDAHGYVCHEMKLETQAGRFGLPRPSVKLVLATLEPQLFGVWRPEDQSVIVNRALLEEDDPQSALGTLVHEIRHALQDAVINGRLEHPHGLEAETEIWRRAGEDYDSGDFMAYLYNPLETDARGAEHGALIGFWKGSYALARSVQPRPE